MSSTSTSNRRTRENSKFVPKPKEEWRVKQPTRNWLDLPSDITMNILQRVGVIDVLANAQKVCTSWHEICKDPAMWRVICMKKVLGYKRFILQESCKNVVDRSQGQLVDLTIISFCDFELFKYIAERSSQLRRLEIKFCYDGIYKGRTRFADGRIEFATGWTEFADKFPLLEELSLFKTDFHEKDIKIVGRCCPLLKILKLNNYYATYKNDSKALAIAENLPKLRNLELIGDSMTNIGLQAILDSCHHLESLDLRHCFNIHLKANLRERCSKQIKYLKLPHDFLPHDFLVDDFN